MYFDLSAYCVNNPVMLVDHSGNFPVPIWATIVGFMKDLFAGFGGTALGASSRMFAKLAGMSLYLLNDVGGAVSNPAFLQGMTKATNLQYGGKVLSGLGKVAKIAGYALLALDCGISIYNNFTNPNLSMSRKITDSIVDVGFSVGGFFAAMGVGAAVGSIGGPAGIIFGAVAGLFVGIGIWAFQTFAVDAYNSIKVGFNTFVTQTIPNAWNDFVNGWNDFWSFSWA